MPDAKVEERDIEFDAPDGARLVGTLTTPSADPSPAALILNGSGPLDRDSAFAGQALGFAGALATQLASVGVGSLRFDKRGVGASAGDYLTMGLDAEIADARAALAALAAAPEIDARRVALIGHSIGAVISARLAATEPSTAAAVLLAGPAVDGACVLDWQSARIAASLPGPSWLLPRLALAQHRFAMRRLSRSRKATIRLPLKRQPALWMREFRAHDPGEDLRRIRCPVLAITGRKDLQVDPDDVARVGVMVAGPFTGETPDDLSHVLRVEPGPGGILTYQSQLRRPVDQALLVRLSDWVAEQLGASEGMSDAPLPTRGD